MSSGAAPLSSLLPSHPLSVILEFFFLHSENHTRTTEPPVPPTMTKHQNRTNHSPPTGQGTASAATQGSPTPSSTALLRRYRRYMDEDRDRSGTAAMELLESLDTYVERKRKHRLRFAGDHRLEDQTGLLSPDKTHVQRNLRCIFEAEAPENKGRKVCCRCRLLRCYYAARAAESPVSSGSGSSEDP